MTPMPTTTPPPASNRALETTFEWRERRMPQRFRLLLFLGLAFLVHAGCFYVFQVGYPSSTRGIPVPVRVMVLSPNDPAAREILREVEDRVAGYGLGPGDRAGTVSLDKYNNYQPSFANYRPKLRGLPRGFSARLPLPGSFQRETLPPARLGFAVRPLEAAPDPDEPMVHFGGGLTSRNVTFRTSLGRLFAKDHGTLAVFTIGVNASGVVEFCLPERDDEFRAEALDALRGEILNFRFERSPESGFVWGSATIEW